MNELKLGEIDLDLKPMQRDLFLCRPDKTTILSLKDINGLKYNMKLGVVDELSFTIPTQVERNHELIDNPLIEKIKHRYLFKLIFRSVTTYFVFNERNKTYGDSESISYRAYGLGYELADKDIRDYEAKSKLLNEMLYDILSESSWKVGYVDGYFNTKYRSHEISSSTVLQAVYDLAEKFNAVIIWDTQNLTVNMYNPSNIGMDKGLRLKPGKYLESFSLTDNSEEVVSRLKIYGQDGLTIRKLTATGANYLEDFSWYMYPFKRDASGKVLSSSDRMSDSLAIALEDYSKHLASLQGQFETLLTQLLAKQDEIQKGSQRLSILLTDLIKIKDELDIYNSSQDGDHADILSRKTAKESEVASLESTINSLMVNEKSIQTSIDTLRAQTKIDNRLTPAQMLELNRFIVVKEYTNDTIVDEQDLLEDGIEAFKKFREPQINLSMNIVNFLSNIESQHDHDKLGLGDTVTTRNSRLQTDIKAKIIEIEIDFDNDSTNLQIANERESETSDEWLDNVMNAAKSTSNTVNMNKFKWGLVEELDSMVSQMLNGHWDATKQSITAGYQQNITISERGIIVKSPENPMDWLVIQNGMLAITNDGGNTWKHAIKSTGIVGDVIIGRLLIGSRLLIEDVDGIIKISGSTMTVYDNLGKEQVVIGKYDNDKYGIKINNGSIDIVGGLTRDNISKSYTDSILYDDSKIRGELRLTSPLPNSITLNVDGITAYTPSTTNFARMDYRGLYVQGGAVDIRTSTQLNRGVTLDGNGLRGYKSDGTESIRIDTTGNAVFAGNLSAAGGTFTGNLSAVGGTFSGNLSAVGGTFSGTLSAVGGSFSGELRGASGTFGGSLSAATGSFSGELRAATGTFNGVYAGTVNATQVNATNLSSISAHLGNITSGNINITESASIGAGLTLKGPGVNTGVYFGRTQIIQTTDGWLSLGQNVSIGAFTKFNGSVDFSAANIVGLSLTAVFG